MKTEDLYITSSVVVRSNKAVHNGIVFFEKKDGDALSFVKDLYKQLKCEYPKFYKMDNLCKLAFVATELLLLNRTISCPKEDVALVFSNAGSSLDTDKTYYASVEDKSNYFPSPAVFVYTLPNIMMGEICIRQQFRGENAFFIAEKFDADLLADYSANLLTSGKSKCVIAGWVEISGNEWDVALFLIGPPAKENSGTRLSKESLNEIYTLKKD